MTVSDMVIKILTVLLCWTKRGILIKLLYLFNLTEYVKLFCDESFCYGWYNIACWCYNKVSLLVPHIFVFCYYQSYVMGILSFFLTENLFLISWKISWHCLSNENITDNGTQLCFLDADIRRWTIVLLWSSLHNMPLQ